MKDQEEVLVTKMLILVQGDEKLANDLKYITSSVGVGDLSSIALLYLFISYSQANRQQILA